MNQEKDKKDFEKDLNNIIKNNEVDIDFNLDREWDYAFEMQDEGLCYHCEKENNNGEICCDNCIENICHICLKYNNEKYIYRSPHNNKTVCYDCNLKHF